MSSLTSIGPTLVTKIPTTLTTYDALGAASKAIQSAEDASLDADTATKELFGKMAKSFKAMAEENVLLKQRNIALESQLSETQKVQQTKDKAFEEHITKLREYNLALEDKVKTREGKMAVYEKRLGFLKDQYEKCSGFSFGPCRNLSDVSLIVCSVERALGTIKWTSSYPMYTARDAKLYP